MTEPALTPIAADVTAGPSHPETVDRLFPVVYDELRRLAHGHLRHEPEGLTLTTTDLVHQAYLQLSAHTRIQWQTRSHFLAVAATAMRRILVDHARARRSQKRGGPLRPVPIDSIDVSGEERDELVVALDEALGRLRALDARQAQVVECRFFGGMTEEETAEALDAGLRTVKRDWARARSWLYAELFQDS